MALSNSVYPQIPTITREDSIGTPSPTVPIFCEIEFVCELNKYWIKFITNGNNLTIPRYDISNQKVHDLVMLLTIVYNKPNNINMKWIELCKSYINKFEVGKWHVSIRDKLSSIVDNIKKMVHNVEFDVMNQTFANFLTMREHQSCVICIYVILLFILC